MSPEIWSAKDVIALLVQCGALGLCFLMMLLGVYYGSQFTKMIGEQLDEVKSAVTDLAVLIHDHKARAGDTPPGRMRDA